MIAAPGQRSDDPAAGTRPAGQARMVSVEGRIEQGVECMILRTPDGQEWSFNAGEADFGPGDYVRIRGEIADASFCQQCEGTLIPQRIDAIEPPARNRDPARAGGVAITRDYVSGAWVAKGADADCGKPDFRINASPAATVLKARIDGKNTSAPVILDQYPRIEFDEPMAALPIETRGPDGLAILRPATDAQYDPVIIGDATIKGDGVVFVKCGD